MHSLKSLNKEINEVLLEIGEANFLENGSISTIHQIKFGVYIFAEDGKETGTLENILIPLMQQENETIFEAAQEFKTTHFDDNRLFPLKIKTNLENGDVIENRSTRKKEKYKFYENKSLIGLVGQLQCSGKSNVVCISDSDYITLEKIRTNSKCIEILEFLNKL